jgi:hypothetical protein
MGDNSKCYQCNNKEQIKNIEQDLIDENKYKCEKFEIKCIPL